MAPATSAARPKRAGEEFARSHDSNPSSSKKPRFDHRNPSTLAPDAPEEDVILDADVIGKSGTGTKRNAVNIDGYESDSDNDNFNARAAGREDATKKKNGAASSKDEEDDDMFADVEEGMQGTADGDDDDDLVREGKPSKKDPNFLDHTEIEGQVMNSMSGGHVSADLLLGDAGQKGKKRSGSVSTSSSSGDDEVRDELPDDIEDAEELGAGAKKKHAPRLDAFNLRDEEEDGRFDESGNFVRKAADPDAVNDSWLEGLSRKDMKRAREAEEKRDEERRRKAVESDAILTSDLLSTLIQHLEVGETPLEALQRLNKGKSKESKLPKWKQKRQGKMDIDEPNGSDAVDPAETIRRNAVDAITGAADALYSREQHEIYEAERELLMRQYKQETGDDWQATLAKEPESIRAEHEIPSGSFEYRWSDARDGGEHHGPYDAATMKAWNEAGYFGEGVEFRRVGDTEWSRLLDVQ